MLEGAGEGRGARIVVREGDVRRARALREALERADIASAALSGAAAVQPSTRGEDVTVVRADADAEFLKAARRAAKGALAIVGGAETIPRADAPFDAWLALKQPGAQMRGALDVIVRDGVLRAEALARRRTAAALGAPPAPPRAAGKRISALFVGAPDPAFLALEHAWTQHGGKIAAVFTSYAAFDHLQDERYDAVLLNAAVDMASAVSLVSTMRRNADSYHMPVLALMGDDPRAEHDALIRRQCQLTRRKDDHGAAVAWLVAAVRQARERAAAQRILRAAPEPRSPWTAATFAAHLETLALAHHGGGRPLSLASLSFAGGNGQPLRELGELAAPLVRASDSLALDGARLRLAFPCTSPEGARAALARLRSIWEHSAPSKNHKRVLNQIVLELAPGESGEALLARCDRG